MDFPPIPYELRLLLQKAGEAFIVNKNRVQPCGKSFLTPHS